MGKFILIKLLTLNLLLSGCTNVTEEQWAEFCSNIRWKEHGIADGKDGKTYKLIGVYKKRCGNQLSSDEEHEYKVGFLEGVTEFCTYDKGYWLGSQNEPDPVACPKEIGKEFYKGFNVGRADFHRREVLENDSKVAAKNAREEAERKSRDELLGRQQ